MVDEIKPPVSGSTTPTTFSSPNTTLPKPSGQSPLTPDIKIPANLPTGEMKPLATAPPPVRPVFPTSQMPSRPPMPTAPFSVSTTTPNPTGYGAKPTAGPRVPLSPPPATKPGLSEGIPTSSQPAVFKSSIRTMQDDLVALKKGQLPAGFKIEKESEKEVKPALQAISPKIMPPPSVSHVELGKLEKSRPLTAEAQKGQEVQKPAVPLSQRFGLSKPTINIPPIGGLFTRLGGLGSKKLLLVVVGLVIVVSVVIGFVVLREPRTLETSITPTFTPEVTAQTPTQVPTVTPLFLESLFSVSDSVGIFIDPDFTARFINSVETDPLLSTREPGIYKITTVDGDKRYSFTDLIGTPGGVPSIVDTISNDDFWLTLAYKSDNMVGFGFIVKLPNPDMTDEAMTAMQNWEGIITQDLENLFQYDSTKAASVGFLDNTYNGSAIRYRNFPDTNATIDYSVVEAKNGESYLVVVNSREHIYKIIDMLK